VRRSRPAWGWCRACPSRGRFPLPRLRGSRTWRLFHRGTPESARNGGYVAALRRYFPRPGGLL